MFYMNFDFVYSKYDLLSNSVFSYDVWDSKCSESYTPELQVL